MTSYFKLRKQPEFVNYGKSAPILKDSFKSEGQEYTSLGTQIKKARELEEPLPTPVSPVYDPKDTDDCDVMCSFRHDRMDIAEEFGHMVDSNMPVIDNDNDNNEN